MNQDQIINWLYNNFDADAYNEAKRNGTAFVYLAGIAQTFPGNTQTQRATTQHRQIPQAIGRVPAPAPARRVEAAPAQDLNAEDEAPAEAPAPTRRQPTRNNNTNNDRVRVGRL